jgi:hypothetical protein
MELLGLRFVDLRSSQRHESMEFDEQRRDIDRRLRVWMLGVLSPDPTLASLSNNTIEAWRDHALLKFFVDKTHPG